MTRRERCGTCLCYHLYTLAKDGWAGLGGAIRALRHAQEVTVDDKGEVLLYMPDIGVKWDAPE